MRRESYDPDCTRCPRLAGFLEETRARYADYWAHPVPSFGDPHARLLIVGLAPGMHGANRTGRPFTGDHAGILLYRSLFEAGLASGPESLSSDDGLELKRARIANAVKCVPPQNKPLPAEVRACNAYLAAEMRELAAVRVFLALGRVAHDAVLLAQGLPRGALSFRARTGTRLERCPHHDRLLSLQPLQHPDAAPDHAHVPRSSGTRLRARRACRARGPHCLRSFLR